MDLILTRKQFRADGIFSELRDEEGNLIAVTLEHAYQDDLPGFVPKIPNGKYLCKRGVHRLASKAHDFTTFEITGVPGCTGILFHVGNFNNDSEGCVLLGRSVETQIIEGNRQYISDSMVTFLKFLSLEDVDQFYLTVCYW